MSTPVLNLARPDVGGFACDRLTAHRSVQRWRRPDRPRHPRAHRPRVDLRQHRRAEPAHAAQRPPAVPLPCRDGGPAGDRRRPERLVVRGTGQGHRPGRRVQVGTSTRAVRRAPPARRTERRTGRRRARRGAVHRPGRGGDAAAGLALGRPPWKPSLPGASGCVRADWTRPRAAATPAPGRCTTARFWRDTASRGICRRVTGRAQRSTRCGAGGVGVATAQAAE